MGTSEGSSEADKVANTGFSRGVIYGGQDLVDFAPELCFRVELVVHSFHRTGKATRGIGGRCAEGEGRGARRGGLEVQDRGAVGVANQLFTQDWIC